MNVSTSGIIFAAWMGDISDYPGCDELKLLEPVLVSNYHQNANYTTDIGLCNSFEYNEIDKVTVIPPLTYDIQVLLSHYILRIIQCRKRWIWTTRCVKKYNKDI